MQSIKRCRYGSAFDIELIDSRSGFVRFRVAGKNIYKYFKNEAGGIRWQRIPPTEKRGRVQTSTITVAVLTEISYKEIQINKKDLSWKFTRGTGPGGMNKNKLDTCVNLTHIPSGIKVRIDGRSQSANKIDALFILRARLKEQLSNKFCSNQANIRKQQIGSGMRGDKIRTIRVKDNIVTDHRLNKKISYKQYARGDLTELR